MPRETVGLSTLDGPETRHSGDNSQASQGGFDDVISYSANGSGNNSADPTGGAAGTAEIRLAPGNPGQTLDPNPRVVSNAIFSAPQIEDTAGRSAYFYAFGQFVDHDLALNVAGTGSLSITVPSDDANLAPGSRITITRGQVNPATGNAVDSVTQFLDLSQIYGSDTETAASLRNSDGTMATSDGGNLPIVDGTMVGGDVRAAENPEITAITILFVREHNHWVGRLHADNPDLSGDQLYSAARAITTAEYQNIVYQEFVPTIVGSLSPYSGYNPEINAQISQEFATVAYRFGHSTVSGEQTPMANDGSESEPKSLADVFFEPASVFVANGGADGLLRDMGADGALNVSPTMTAELRNLLNSGDDQGDLAAIDIMREADLGIATLNQTRAALGLSPYASFSEITSDTGLAEQLQALYGTPDKLNLFVGGLSEDHASGAAVGETFRAIIAKQFENLRDGDRLFYLNQHFGPQLTAEIEATRLSDVIMRDANTPIMQSDAFKATVRHSSDVASPDPEAPQLVIGIDDDGATVSGSPGVDNTIVAGSGLNQVLTGGGSTNRFVFLGPGHSDSVTNFDPAKDVLDFKEAAATGDIQMKPNDFCDVSILAADGGSLISFGGDRILLSGIAPEQLSAGNFLINQDNPHQA